jgi:hypothetical protein
MDFRIAYQNKNKIKIECFDPANCNLLAMNARLQRIVTGSRFAGLEIQFLNNGIEFHLIILRRKGQQLVVEKSVSAIETIEKLSVHLSKDIPLSIAFTGKGILHRRIAVNPDSDGKILLSRVLPNASLNDFYLQAVSASQDELFVSVLRKSVVDELLEQLKLFSVVTCSLGPVAVMNILGLLDESKTEMNFGSHSLHFQNGLVEEVYFLEINSEKKILDIGGQKISDINLLAFAAAFQQLIAEEQRMEMVIETLSFSKEEFLHRKLFKTGVEALLIVTLLLLLGNYFIFSHYWSEKNMLESKLQTDGGAFIHLRKLESEVRVKRCFLQQAGLLGQSNNSYYADQIAFSLPQEILLTRMDIAPRLKLTEEDSIGFKPGIVEIDGTCSQSIVLNKWLHDLEEKKWIKGATLESYLQDKTMKQGEFEIALDLK